MMVTTMEPSYYPELQDSLDSHALNCLGGVFEYTLFKCTFPQTIQEHL